MKITFLGATETVTGSKYLLELDDKRVLIDCGLFQGYKELRLRNWAKLPVEPASIDCVLLTHAHIDHSGYLPLLVNNGFSGKVYCSSATQELCAVLLPDSGHLHEEEARFANRYGYSKHKPALPLYTREQAIDSLQCFVPCDYDHEYVLGEHASFCFNRAGHILGASTIVVKQHGVSILFSGDLGRQHDPIMHAPVMINQPIDYIVIESTYGDRKHSELDPVDQIADAVNRTAKRGGSILIPAFAVGRAQSVMYCIYLLKKQQRIANIPVYLDSPMAIDATKIFYQYVNEHKLTPQECYETCSQVNYVHSVDESKELDIKPMPKIIISASGMATGGRILHHLKALAPDHRNTILFTGFQAGGTRGDRMIRGEKSVKMLGQMVNIAAEVIQLQNLSAHADVDELFLWMQSLSKPPRHVFITHGELSAAKAMKQKITEQLGWNCSIPSYLQTEELV